MTAAANVPETTDNNEFLRLADPFRRELMAHCYRMLGSVHDAEDLVQETYLRAWRAYDRFEGRSSLRTWLHRIATTACLTALENRGKRPMPTGLGAPSSDPLNEPVNRPEVPWLEPLPDASVESDPATVVTGRESLRLAIIAAMQHLPPRQRAVLILRDVLQWRAAEVAELLETSTAAVNSALQRARAQLAEVAPERDQVFEPAEADQRAMLDRYVSAFERKDIAGIIGLLTSDAVWEMPPFEDWYSGPDAVAYHLRHRCPGGPGDLRFVPVRANNQPGFAVYLRSEGEYRAFLVQVLHVEADGIRHVANFLDPELFQKFGLPQVLTDAE